MHLVQEWCACSYTFFISQQDSLSNTSTRLLELGNITATMSVHPCSRSGGATSDVLPITLSNSEGYGRACASPNLLTYLLGKGFVSGSAKFKGVWDKIHTQLTLYELLEVVHPAVPLDARMELVVTRRLRHHLGTVASPK